MGGLRKFTGYIIDEIEVPSRDGIFSWDPIASPDDAEKKAEKFREEILNSLFGENSRRGQMVMGLELLAGTLIAEFFLETVPQLLLQGINNSEREGAWTEFTILSFTISLLVGLDTVYRLGYKKFFEEDTKGNETWEIMVGNDLIDKINKLGARPKNSRVRRESLKRKNSTSGGFENVHYATDRGSSEPKKKASARPSARPGAKKKGSAKKSKRGAKSSKGKPNTVQTTFDFGLSDVGYNASASAENDAMENYDVLPDLDAPLDASQYQDDGNDMYGGDSADYDARTTADDAEYATPGADDYMELEEGTDTYMQVEGSGSAPGGSISLESETFGGFDDEA